MIKPVTIEWTWQAARQIDDAMIERAADAINGCKNQRVMTKAKEALEAALGGDR